MLSIYMGSNLAALTSQTKETPPKIAIMVDW